MYIFLCPDIVNAIAETLETDGTIKAIKMLRKVDNPFQLGMRMCKVVVEAIDDGRYELDRNGYYAIALA
jgi:hypothetical protein